MWPVLLDMTKEESMQCLRNLELEAYAHLVSAFRAQGPLNPDKRKLLKETGLALNIAPDRHKAEIRRAINDERLNTIAYHVSGLPETAEDWAQEGRRTIPLLPRMAPQTAYSAIADEAAEVANQTNRQLPPPACTERKRLLPTCATNATPLPDMKPFRIPEPPIGGVTGSDVKKRKLSICPENSTLAQHLLGPAKMSRTQQFYRQRNKAIMKNQGVKLKQEPLKSLSSKLSLTMNGPKATLNQSNNEVETIEQIQNEINNYPLVQKQNDQNHTLTSSPSTSTCSNENQAPVRSTAKLLSNLKQAIAFKSNNLPGPSNEQKMLKVCSSRKSLSKPTPLGQKLIVVSNAQTIPSNSILQKSLSIPLVKNLSIKNLEKFKIVTTSSMPTTLQMTTTAGNVNSLKHKVVTVKTNPTTSVMATNTTTATKKVIPLSQLLSTKGGIKILPIGGKIVGKTTVTTATSTTTTTVSSPLYITMGNLQNKMTVANKFDLQSKEDDCNLNKENGKSSVLSDILKASGVTSDDFDAQIEKFRIPNNHFKDLKEEAMLVDDVETEKLDVLHEEKNVRQEQKEFVEADILNEVMVESCSIEDNVK